MTFVLIVLLLGIAYWGFKKSSANAELHRHKSALGAECAAMHAISIFRWHRLVGSRRSASFRGESAVRVRPWPRPDVSSTRVTDLALIEATRVG
jgi:hypothetical protein